MESWNWRVQGLVWRVSVQFSWEVPESFVDNFGMHVIRVLGGVVDVFGLPSLATRSGFRFLVSLAVLGCGPCRGAVGRVGFRPSQMRSHCVVWEGVFGGGLSQFSWGWENRVSCTVLLSPLSRLSILKQREQLQVRRMKQLCWWVVLFVFQWSCVEGRLPPFGRELILYSA